MNSRVLGLSTRKGNLGSAGFSCFRGVLYCGKERGGVVVFGSLLFEGAGRGVRTVCRTVYGMGYGIGYRICLGYV
jgi:hypothetical protein